MKTSSTRRTFLAAPLALPAYFSGDGGQAPGSAELGRRDALDAIMPYWLRHAPDPQGGFYPNLTRRWDPVPPFDQVPLLIGRHAYGFSTAFQLSGNPKYLAAARAASEYLLMHAWDNEYGGWYDLLDRAGRPTSDTKTVSYQIYVNAGLTAWYAATGDTRALRNVLRSVELQRLRAHDPQHGGWGETFSRDLRVTSWGKNKHAHYDYAGAVLLNLHLATRDPSALAWARELMDLSLERLRDGTGWFHGFLSRLDREWRRVPLVVNGRKAASTGAQLTAALALLRLYEQTRERRYLDAGVDLVERTQRFGWNEHSGAWSELVGEDPPGRIDGPAVWWWIQVYGAMAQLRLHAITAEAAWLRAFRRSEEFYERAFRDRTHGGVYASATPEGGIGNDAKALSSAWKASYHETEHALVSYLYSSLFVERRPAVLHFQLDGPARHFTSLVDDPAVGIDRVRMNGQLWRDFNNDDSSVQLPEGRAWTVEVRLVPPVARARKAPDARARIQQRMQLAMGAFPAQVRVPLDVRTLEEISESGYTRRKIEFAAEPGDRVTAYLLIPAKGKRPLPAVLCLHPTHPQGKGVPVGLAGDPGRNYAQELAGRGFVTLAPDYPGFGDCHTDPYALGYASASAKGIWNHMRAIDLLASLPEVDRHRIAVAGHSLGGHNALFLAAFDPRVRAAVTSCGFTSFTKYKGGDLAGWSHQGYMPRIAAVYGNSPARMPFDFSDVLAAIAPRPVFVNAPLGDDNFDASGVDDCVQAARASGARVTVRHPDAGHSFSDDMRAEAYAFLERSLGAAAPALQARVVDVRRIWDRGAHNAFTDLTRLDGHWFCTFREAGAHVSPDGAIRVLTAPDGLEWRSAALISLAGRDLRDPKLSITPDGRLMLIAAGVVREPESSSQMYTWFSKDGANWGEPARTGEPGMWLWRVSWHRGAAYGIGYGQRDGKEIARLYRSRDGVRYETLVSVLFEGGYPNESSIVFRSDGSAVCLLRRDKETATAQLGTARAPYTNWTWRDLGIRVGGPHLLETAGGRILAGVRLYDSKVRTALCSLDVENARLDEIAGLPSGGDSSYPGLLWHAGMIWMSYYSSHESRTSIYLARLTLS